MASYSERDLGCQEPSISSMRDSISLQLNSFWLKAGSQNCPKSTFSCHFVKVWKRLLVNEAICCGGGRVYWLIFVLCVRKNAKWLIETFPSLRPTATPRARALKFQASSAPRNPKSRSRRTTICLWHAGIKIIFPTCTYISRDLRRFASWISQVFLTKVLEKKNGNII